MTFLTTTFGDPLRLDTLPARVVFAAKTPEMNQCVLRATFKRIYPPATQPAKKKKKQWGGWVRSNVVLVVENSK
jgi:hypothetical protein